jgi:hypothetical protein
MSKESTAPIHITGEERERPEIRKLARACLELARIEIQAQHHQELPPGEESVRPPSEPEDPGAAQ